MSTLGNGIQVERHPEPLLAVRGLSTRFVTARGAVEAVRDVSWDLFPGEVLGIVGESGSGKTASVMSLVGLLPPSSAVVHSGSAVYQGRDLLQLSTAEMSGVLGQEIGVIFQDSLAAFNPVKRVGQQITEGIRTHNKAIGRAGARQRAIELLRAVRIPDPERRFSQFPHEYSGGMRQRAVIAMAMANRPSVLIADEPTTAVDVTTQAQILSLLREIRRDSDPTAATVLITHDLGLIAETADRVVVMYAGRVVESASVYRLFREPRHPYTRGLLSSLPQSVRDGGALASIPGQPLQASTNLKGCAFMPRCSVSAGREICRAEDPGLAEHPKGHFAACHFADEMDQFRAVEEE